MKTLKSWIALWLGAKKAFDEIKDFWLLRQNCLKKGVMHWRIFKKKPFRENRISITATVEEVKDLQNSGTAKKIIYIQYSGNNGLTTCVHL